MLCESRVCWCDWCNTSECVCESSSTSANWSTKELTLLRTANIRTRWRSGTLLSSCTDSHTDDGGTHTHTTHRCELRRCWDRLLRAFQSETKKTRTKPRLVITYDICHKVGNAKVIFCLVPIRILKTDNRLMVLREYRKVALKSCMANRFELVDNDLYKSYWKFI